MRSFFRRSTYGAAASLTAVASLGVLGLWTPFSLDQSLFAYGARTILAGRALYLEFWDIKQPGIFFFYALGGRLFGLDEVGIHILELTWLLAASLVLIWIARQSLARPEVAALAPLASVGVFLAHAADHDRTQVESLVVLPLALALAASGSLVERPRSVPFGLLLGASVALIGAFKLIYVVLPAVFVLLAAVELWRRRGLEAIALVARIAGISGIGLVAVWAPLVTYFAAHGAMAELLWTSFGYPMETVQQIPVSPLSRLRESSLWALRIYLPWAPLILLGLAGLHRSRRPTLSWGVAAYFALGVALIWIQRTSWWSYHFALLFPPLGLLATFGLEHLLEFASRRGTPRAVIVPLVTLLLVVPVGSLAVRAEAQLDRLSEAAASRPDAPLAVRLDEHYLRIWDKTSFLRERGRPGTLYVLGDPRIQWLSGRDQAIAVHGHSWHLFPARMWRRLPDDLMAAEPTYVFLNGVNQRLLAQRAPELLDWLSASYRPIRRFHWGRLHERRR